MNGKIVSATPAPRLDSPESRTASEAPTASRPTRRRTAPGPASSAMGSHPEPCRLLRSTPPNAARQPRRDRSRPPASRPPFSAQSPGFQFRFRSFSFSANEAVIVWVAQFARAAGVGFPGVVADKVLVDWVPLQFLPEAEGDHTQVTNGDRTMAHFDFADGRFARADAVEEIAHVIVALVEPFSTSGQRRFDQRFIAGLECATA